MLIMICLTISVGALRLHSHQLTAFPLLASAGGYVLDETLVDSHLEAVPGLGTLTTGGLAGGDLEDLGGEADGSLDAEVLVLGAVDQVRGDYASSVSAGLSGWW